ncbi:MAG: GTP-binding protein Era [Candidatus Bipolaricaulis sibiricus]|uniref:GTPase Era n=1 Tax=Bipolaricaulis sibiricus TaxID=2501609 RepID=A0A410FTP0_BIPS1|nr:MAG: GTP-binding protein Era [Candidatus Bipolaricaulis sibiricus]
MAYRTGTVAVIGRTNVGKSTFINAVVGRKVVIVSDKPQTTRNRIRCILTTPEAQVVFVDTPGLHQPVNKLSAHLQREALRSLAGLDVLVYVTEPTGRVDPYDALMLPRIQTLPCPKVLLVNKSDLARGNNLPETLLAYDRLNLFSDIVPVSSTKGTNLDRALAVIIGHLPEGTPSFDAGTITDRPLAFVAAELVREKLYAETYQELPYATAVDVEEIEERADPALTSVYATIIVAKESQKAIVIGSRGSKLKEIGTQARLDLENLLGHKVFLSLHVKVKPKWTEDEAEVARLTGD